MKTNRRSQTPKPRTGPNPGYVEAMQDLRRSNAAGSHRTATDYRRKPKHVKKGWED